MPSFEHDELLRQILALGKIPTPRAEYIEWLKAKEHVKLLTRNAIEDELIVYASSDSFYVNSVTLPSNALTDADHEDLLGWSCDVNSPRTSYVWSGVRGYSIEENPPVNGSTSLNDAKPLIFQRYCEGLDGAAGVYYEILQEYSHLADIHWRAEQSAYCRYDENGDIRHSVSITKRSEKTDSVAALVSFKREELEEYLVISDSMLIRMFDFTLVDSKKFRRWPDGPAEKIVESKDFFYRQQTDPDLALYKRGIQLVPPRHKRSDIVQSKEHKWFGDPDRQYASFISRDWRNRRIEEISTHPSATTNYMQANDNSLPFEVSPAFFRPEVLLKYKSDSEKYTVRDRHIYCRGAWYLKDYDVNKAGQVHAYICDLRRLPYQEQLYWKSFNEAPKAGISARAFANDFEARWVMETDPLQELKGIVENWKNSNASFWKLGHESLIDRVNVPLTSSRDEWSQAFVALSKLLIEGFQISIIRARLDDLGVAYNKGDYIPK